MGRGEEVERLRRNKTGGGKDVNREWARGDS
jgi:hypothetical protein